ncbi:MAG: L-2-hydroxyglutarate oxidase [Calditrichaeota bacterium]|nr:MAG: L-2-hydroxyglutarate oxidase [Calditrichota bacterium]MBL1205510.1 L-2-hydroxyglutarate oxidase [Calditrichota bacterium]NOG45338.1 L-2-hydroxyglutarate oxidase [Calditrichota bacterium]
MNESKIYDIAIIGAGIIGLATALKLSQRANQKIIVIDTEKEVAAHQTGNNSGVIHSGLYYTPGSLKAQNCVNGRNAMYVFCETNQIKHERCGKIVVATNKKELAALKRLYQRGVENKLKGVKRLSAKELREYEPNVSGIAGLLVPETGIVDYKDVCKAYMYHIKNSGNEISLDTKFLKLHKKETLILETTKGSIHTKNIINCAGLYSDRVAKLCGVNPHLKIVPFRGEYYELVPDKHHLVNNLIYPVPDPSFPFLGVHFTRMIHGGVEAGPNAVLAFKREGYIRSDFDFKDFLETLTYPGFLLLAAKYWYTGFGEFYRSYSKKAFVKALQKLIPDLQEEDISPAGAGVRAQALRANGKLVDDFHIEQAKNMVHVLNAPSPAATASLSIGETIAKMAAKNFDL